MLGRSVLIFGRSRRNKFAKLDALFDYDRKCTQDGKGKERKGGDDLIDLTKCACPILYYEALSNCIIISLLLLLQLARLS